MAIESSHRTATVAAFADGRLVGEREISAGEDTARSLAPTLAELVSSADWQPRQVGLIAVSCGPGSFTGLRVGITTAKAWAYAAGADLVGVATPVAIAQRVPCDVDEVWTVDDAQRGQIFATLLRRDSRGSGIFRPCGPTRLAAWRPWCEALRPGTTITGPALAAVDRDVRDDMHLVESSRWSPTAAAVAEVGWVMYQGGVRDDPWSLEPQYVRRSAAEERLATPDR